MDATDTTPTTDAVGLINRLDADAIRQRIADIDRERRALMVLLRAAMRSCRPQAEPSDGGSDADRSD